MDQLWLIIAQPCFYMGFDPGFPIVVYGEPCLVFLQRSQDVLSRLVVIEKGRWMKQLYKNGCFRSKHEGWATFKWELCWKVWSTDWFPLSLQNGLLNYTVLNLKNIRWYFATGCCCNMQPIMSSTRFLANSLQIWTQKWVWSLDVRVFSSTNQQNGGFR